MVISAAEGGRDICSKLPPWPASLQRTKMQNISRESFSNLYVGRACKRPVLCILGQRGHDLDSPKGWVEDEAATCGIRLLV